MHVFLPASCGCPSPASILTGNPARTRTFSMRAKFSPPSPKTHGLWLNGMPVDSKDHDHPAACGHTSRADFAGRRGPGQPRSTGPSMTRTGGRVHCDASTAPDRSSLQLARGDFGDYASDTTLASRTSTSTGVGAFRTARCSRLVVGRGGGLDRARHGFVPALL